MVVKSNSDSDSIIYKFERVPSNAGCVDYVGGIDWILWGTYRDGHQSRMGHYYYIVLQLGIALEKKIRKTKGA